MFKVWYENDNETNFIAVEAPNVAEAIKIAKRDWHIKPAWIKRVETEHAMLEVIGGKASMKVLPLKCPFGVVRYFVDGKLLYADVNSEKDAENLIALIDKENPHGYPHLYIRTDVVWLCIYGEFDAHEDGDWEKTAPDVFYSGWDDEGNNSVLFDVHDSTYTLSINDCSIRGSCKSDISDDGSIVYDDDEKGLRVVILNDMLSPPGESFKISIPAENVPHDILDGLHPNAATKLTKDRFEGPD